MTAVPEIVTMLMRKLASLFARTAPAGRPMALAAVKKDQKKGIAGGNRMYNH
jgi:hypothetical protein